MTGFARTLVGLLLAAGCNALWADDPAAEKSYLMQAKIHLLQVKEGKTTSIDTQLTGAVESPLKSEFGGVNGTLFKIEITRVPGASPTQFKAQIYHVQGKGANERVLASPTLITLAGQPATVQIGNVGGDRLELELEVRELPEAKK